MQIFKSLLIVISSLVCLFIVLNTLAAAEEKPVHPGYPFVFDITGTLERMSDRDRQLVVDDSLFKLSSATTLHAPDSTFTQSAAFQKGDQIGLILKDKTSREVLSIWLIKKAD